MSLVYLSTVRDAVARLRAGDVVVYPTETAYALGADATDRNAVAKVFSLKGRPAGKALPVIVASVAMAERYCRFSEAAERLARRHWPGPLTLVLPARRRRFPSHLLGPSHTVGVRVSARREARALSRELGRPIVATSANVSGDVPAYTVREVERAFGAASEVVYFLARGTLRRRRPSTVARLSGDHLTVLRQGSVRV